MSEYYVNYSFGTRPHQAGPYSSHDEAEIHRRDIASYAGIRECFIDTRPLDPEDVIAALPNKVEEQVSGQTDELLPCPFCGNELYRSPRSHNPKAYCVTEDCYGKRMSVVNLDDPIIVAMWNARAALRRPAPTEPDEPVAMLGGIHGVALVRHIKAMKPAAQTEYHTPLYRSATTEPVRAAAIEECAKIAEGTGAAMFSPGEVAAVEALRSDIVAGIRALAPAGTDTLKHMWDQVEQARSEGTFSSPAGDAGREAEPVAWRAFCQKTGGQMVQTSGLKDMLIEQANSLYAEHGYELQPLYATPQPAARIGREEAVEATFGEDGYNPAYDDGITYAIRMLAQLTDSKDWQMKDGSENHDQDVCDTIMDVLKCAGLYDDETGKFAALTARDAGECTDPRAERGGAA